MKLHISILILPLFLLAACSNASLDKLHKAALPDDPYLAVLASQYRTLSDASAGDSRWDAAQFYADKGLAAAFGHAEPPENPANWPIAADQSSELSLAYNQLQEALTPAIQEKSPRAAANAVAFYDCWVQKTSAKEADAELCRDGFRDAITALTRPVTAAESDAPAADVALSTSFLVFFGWDESSLNVEGKGVVNKVVAYLKKLETAGYEIVVNGHTDRSGDESYNLTLSNARADMVKSSLVKSGVAAEKITTYGFGESDPRVKTPDGVRERANRRVEIFIE